ncbi:MAG: hypothetical protein IIU06_08205 [Erysipelotrichales bacterium]|nr:hypothetical protein [Erysipelotrichales bacterium]
MKKLFGGLNITWPKLIISAVILGIYTGIMAMAPFAKDTSLADISIYFDRWVLFGILIIMNSKSAKESALKCFVFFLISQPLVFLVQVPFNAYGWGIFVYYKYWFMWTLLTIPMGYIGYHMKQNKLWGVLILAPMLLLVGLQYYGYVHETVTFFPRHLYSCIFCVITMILYSLFVFDNRKNVLICTALTAVILLASTGWAFTHKSAYDTQLLSSGGERTGIEYDDSYKVYLADPDYGTVKIVYIESIETYMVQAHFTKLGDTELTLESPSGEKTVYKLTVYRNSYEVERKP